MKIDDVVRKLESKMIIDKDFFYNHPEPGLKEIKTSEYIIKRLKKMGYTDINNDIFATGIVATLKGEKEGPCIMFRSELDAVTMDESGRVKHTCGHHAHMTVLLALAQILIDQKENISGTVKLLFEPDEEGSGGADKMIKNGALENPKVDKVFSLHVWSEFKENVIAIKEGPVMASTDPFEITISGKGGHAAIPEKCTDTIYVANKVGVLLKEKAKFDVPDDEKIVLGITAITGGKNNNVIPSKVNLKGICRTFNNDIRKNIKKEIKEEVENLARELGAKAEFKFIGNYPATINSKEESEAVKEISEKVVGEVITDYKTMCSEDFSYFLEKVPGAMIFVGCQRGMYYPQHNENFTVGINPILIGTQIFYDIVKKYMME